MPKRLPVYQLKDLPVERHLHEGRMTRRSVRTKHAQVVFAEITPQPQRKQGHHRKPHDHPYDQLVVVTKGILRMEIDGLDYELREGSAIVVPAFAMHRGYAAGDVPPSIIEVFAPVRHDYIHLVEHQEEDFGDNGEPWVAEGSFSWNQPD